MPAGEPIMIPAPDDSVKLPAPLRVLVPMLSVAPLFTVKSMRPEIVPPDVNAWVPAFLKNTEVVLLPISCSVPPVIEQSPLRLRVALVLLTSVVVSVPALTIKFPVMFMVTVAPLLA